MDRFNLTDWNKFVIKKSIIDRLSAKDLLHSEYVSIQNDIHVRTAEVWNFILTVSKRGHSNILWDYGNKGDFDPRAYDETIRLRHYAPDHKNKNYNYNNSFPTRFLWEASYVNEVKNHLHNLENPDCGKNEEMAKKFFELMLSQISFLHEDVNDLGVDGSTKTVNNVFLCSIQRYGEKFQELTGIQPIFNGDTHYFDEYLNIDNWALFPVVK